MKKLRIIDIIGTPNAILHKFGIQVFESISPILKSNQEVTLSFEGLKNITSGFCNASIGKAYLDFNDAGKLLTIEGAENNPIWQEKINDAIILARDPEKISIQDTAISELFC